MTLGRMKSFTPATPLRMNYALAGEIKAVGAYRLKIKGVVFGTVDRVGDRFLPTTDFGATRDFRGMPVYYDHAQRSIKSQIGQVAAWENTGDSLDFEIELDRAKAYAADVMRLFAEKALGASTGALGHLVVRENGVLKRWLIGEISLTPTPCERLTIPTKSTPAKAQPSAYVRELYDLMAENLVEAAREPHNSGAALRAHRLQQALQVECKAAGMSAAGFERLILDAKRKAGL